MHIKSRKPALAAVILLLVITASVIYKYNLAVYTAHLDSRPFNAGLTGKIESLEPAQLVSNPENMVASAMYEGLVYYDEDSQSLKPRLAKSWSYSNDGRCLTIHLKKNIKFNNGKKLTAADVKACWEYNFVNIKEWYKLSMILSVVGVKERLAGKKPDITGIQVIDEYTLKVNFVKPDAAFIYALVNPIFWVKDTGDKINLTIGTGPYILKENKDNRHLFLVRNENYHRGSPRLSAINVTLYDREDEAFKDYQAGKLDYLDVVPGPEIKNIKKNSQYKGLFINRPLLETYFLGFNLNRLPYARNYLLRRALNYAIDREAIINNVFGGAYQPARGILPRGVVGYNEHMRGYTYNIEKAQELLAEAGFPEGRGLSPLTLTYNSNPGHRLVAGAVAGQLAKLGIEVQLQEQEWTYFKKQLTGMNMSFFRVGWQGDYPDADNFLYSMFHSSQMGLSNFMGYYNPQVDKILDEARAQVRDSKARVKLLSRAEQIIIDDAPCLWLFQKESAQLIGKNVSGLKVDSMGMIDWYQVEMHRPDMEDSLPKAKTN